jgi:hypothetical protein
LKGEAFKRDVRYQNFEKAIVQTMQSLTFILISFVVDKFVHTRVINCINRKKLVVASVASCRNIFKTKSKQKCFKAAKPLTAPDYTKHVK